MKIGKIIGDFFDRRRAFNELSKLDDSSLKDIGLSRSEIRSRVYSV